MNQCSSGRIHCCYRCDPGPISGLCMTWGSGLFASCCCCACTWSCYLASDEWLSMVVSNRALICFSFQFANKNNLVFEMIFQKLIARSSVCSHSPLKVKHRTGILCSIAIGSKPLKNKIDTCAWTRSEIILHSSLPATSLGYSMLF